MKYRIKDIKGFPGYSIDTKGKVWSHQSGAWKKLKAGGRRYSQVVLCKDDDKYNKGVTVSPSHLKFNVDMGKMKRKI